MYINGRWIQTNDRANVVNPANREIVGQIDLGGKVETEQAIAAADKAFKSWSVQTAEMRASYLHLIANKIQEKEELFAQTITKEMGKSIHNARYEVKSTVSFFQWYAEEARRIYGETVPSSDSSKRITTIKQPVGVVGAITPWNFPLSMIARKFAPALATGCTIILKPAKEAPLSAIELFKVIDEVGLPKGVANLILGKSSEIASVLMESEIVKKITFTGSTEVGKILIRQSADTVKRVSMELGGHAPFIVFEDADLDLAIEGLIKSKFASTGQQCVCPNRIYVHEKIYEEFSERLVKRVSELRVGDGLDELNDIGSMINEEGIQKSHEHVTDAVEKGATIACGGKTLTEGEYSKGYFYAPTVLENIQEGMKILTEETFGPVIPLIRFNSDEEVVEMANDIEYGLASYFYSNNLSRVHRVSEQLEYGMVGVNDPAPFVVQAPFGGVKESGLGREGGHQGLDDYLETKLISIKLVN